MKINNKYEVLTPEGWSDFDGVKQTTTDILFIIEFDDNSTIKCTANHLLKFPNGQFLEASFCFVGDELFGGKIITEISYLEGEFEVYDLLNVEKNNEYFTGGVVSHNCAFMPEADEIWTSAQMTLATGGDAIVLSTPNGHGNLFHKLWQKAEEGANQEALGRLNPIKLNWNLHPDRDKAWRDAQDELLGKRQAAQECVTGDTLITVRNEITQDISRLTIHEYINLTPNHIFFTVLTPTGFKKFEGLRTTYRTSSLKLYFSNGSELNCTPEHRLIFNGVEKYADRLAVGDCVECDDGVTIVTKIEELFDEDYFYDLFNVDGHVYYTNDILSHNCDCDFSTSGHTVIETEHLEYFRQQIQEPIEKRGIGGDYWIWNYPNYTKSYAVVADVSRGDGEDYSTFEVYDVETMEQCAEFKGKIDTNMFGNMLVAVATEYNTALLVIDNKNIGWSTVQVCLDKGYTNLYYSYKHDPYLDVSIHLRKGYDMRNKEDMVAGFSSNTIIRPVMISKLEMASRERTLSIKSSRLWNELTVFMWINGKAQAQKGYNDDLVICVCTFLFIRDTALRLRTIGIELNKQAISHVHRTVYKPKQNSHPNWEQNVGNRKENLKWLL